MALGNINNLHTASTYITSRNNLVGQTKSQTDLDTLYLQVYLELKDQELSFYQQFGYNSAEAFYAGIKNIMAAAGPDLKILQRLSSYRIRQSLKGYANNAQALFGTQPFVLSLKMEKNNKDELKQLLNSIKGGNDTIQYEFHADRVNISLTWDVPAIKQIISKTQKRYFKEQSTDVTALLRYMRNDSSDLVKVYQGDNVTNPTVKFNLRASPFNYEKKELDAYLEQNNISKLIEIRKNILNFLISDLGIASGSTDFKNAAWDVLEQVIGNKITDISFFTGGGNGWIDNVVGAMGEFQSAIFFNYIARKCPNKNLATKISEIVGNDTDNYNHMLHSDLQILEAFGIQVKNYGSASIGGIDKTITVRLHPMEVAPLMRDQELVSYVINSYFNQSVSQISDIQWEEFFEQNAIELLNLHLPSFMPTHITIPAKVSFYLIGGHLVPGSEIIAKSFLNKTGKDIINVSSSVSAETGYTDTGYVTDEVNGHPRFIEWWYGQKGHWTPTEQNNLGSWDKRISIRTTFNYRPVWDMDMFKVF